MHVFPAYVDDIVGKLIREDPTINCIIVDTFYLWPSMIAEKHNLVNISFFTKPARVLTLYYHVELLRKNGHFASKENRTDAIDYIPGVKSIMPTDLMSYLQAKDDIFTTVHQIISKAFEDVNRADFILCNTVQEFEDETISQPYSKNNHSIRLARFSLRASPRAPSPRAYGSSQIAPNGSTPIPMARSCTSHLVAMLTLACM